jgi:putative photosynthetic complex assembly protein 2
MTSAVWPVLLTIFTWWFTTGVILYLDGLDRSFSRSVLGLFTVILAGSIAGAWLVSAEVTPIGAYLGFLCGIGAWAWMEISFLSGHVTGPRKTACPADASGFQRFRLAVAAILWHEFAIIAGAAALALASWQMPNQIALWTYCILWVMRTSAKLNLFLGARNLSEDFLPERMRYLASYFRQAPINMLFPVSVTAGTAGVVVLASAATHVAATDFSFTAMIVLATLLALAVLEHWLMILPLPAERLWSWGMASHNKTKPNLPNLGKTITPAE